MNKLEYVNCYCFNSGCARSIFNAKFFACIELPLSQVLSQEVYCPVCNSELVSKPVLEIKGEVYKSLQAAGSVAGLFDGEPENRTDKNLVCPIK